MKNIGLKLFSMICFFVIVGNVMAAPVEVINSSFSTGADCYSIEGTDCYAYSDAFFFGVSAAAYAYSLDDEDSSYAYAEAAADITFRPLDNFNTLTFYQQFFPFIFEAHASLYDLTNGTVILSAVTWTWNDGWPNENEETVLISYGFRSDHIYRMSLYVSVGDSDAGNGPFAYIGFPDLQAVSVSVSVSEPATMLLLGLGLMGVLGIRRKIKK